jgi:hypothetical protein
MQVFDIRRGHYKNIENNGLENMMTDIFGNVEMEGDRLKSSFGAMDPITVWVKSKKELCVDINTKTDVSDEEALNTIRAKNDFLQQATGFSTKERSKRMQKKAKEGKL